VDRTQTSLFKTISPSPDSPVSVLSVEADQTMAILLWPAIAASRANRQVDHTQSLWDWIVFFQPMCSLFL
jgi:hypothetical protein